MRSSLRQIFQGRRDDMSTGRSKSTKTLPRQCALNQCKTRCTSLDLNWRCTAREVNQAKRGRARGTNAHPQIPFSPCLAPPPVNLRWTPRGSPARGRGKYPWRSRSSASLDGCMPAENTYRARCVLGADARRTGWWVTGDGDGQHLHGASTR